MHGIYVREIPQTTENKTWEWLRKRDLKVATKALICASQEQALQTNYVKCNIDKTKDSPMCILCGNKVETICHIVSKYKILAKRNTNEDMIT